MGIMARGDVGLRKTQIVNTPINCKWNHTNTPAHPVEKRGLSFALEASR